MYDCLQHHSPAGLITSIIIGVILGWITVWLATILGGLGAILIGGLSGSVGAGIIAFILISIITIFALLMIPTMIFGKKGNLVSITGWIVAGIIICTAFLDPKSKNVHGLSFVFNMGK